MNFEHEHEHAFAMKAVLQSDTYTSRNFSNIKLVNRGYGGFGVVYSIFNENSPTGLIIKVPNFDRINSEFRSSNKELLKEIDVLVKLKDCKNVLTVYDSGTINFEGSEICYYIAEELIGIPRNYEPANDIFFETNPRHPERKNFSEQQVCSFIMDITQALCDVRDVFASEEESVKTAHRDIKLKNIMYSEDQNRHRIYKLIDFGNFKHYFGDTMGGDTGTGTAFTMAPERFVPNSNTGKKGIPHPANDVFGLAYVLYKLLSKSGLSLVKALENEFSGTNYSEIENFDDANITFLKDLYRIDIESYYSNHRGEECLPREQLFDSNHLYGSSELRSIVRSMFHMDYRVRPSAEDIQVMILQLIVESNFVISVEDFEECSGYGLYQDELRKRQINDDLKLRRTKHSNTESFTKDEDTPDQLPKSKRKDIERVNHARNHNGLFLYISIWLETIVNISVMALPLFSFTAYEKLIDFITGGKPLYSEEKMYLYVFPLIAAVLARLILLPIVHRAFYKLQYKSNETITLRIILLALSIAIAVGFGGFDIVHFRNSLPEQLNISSICFIIRRVFETVLTTSISICAITVIEKEEKYRSHYIFTNPKTYPRFSLSDIIEPLVFLIIPLVILFLTPCFKFLLSLFENDINNIANTLIAAKQDNTVANDYIRSRLTDVDTNTVLLGLTTFSFLLYGLTVALPMFIIVYGGIIYYISRPMKGVAFRKLKNERSRQIRSRSRARYSLIPFSALWKKLNKTELCELEINHYELSAEDVTLIAKGMKQAAIDEDGKPKLDERNRIIEDDTGIKSLTTVNLDYNDIGEIADPWNSHNIKEFSARECSLSDVSGLRTLNFLEKLDLSNNQIEDISFILKSRAYECLQYLDISFNDIAEDQVNLVIEKCCNLDTLILDECCRSESIYSLGFVSNLTKLKTLSANDNRFADLTPLKGKTIVSLSLSRCGISDISVFSEDVFDFFSDTTLNLSNNEITDIQHLPAKTYKTLVLSGNPISDFLHLRNLKGDTLQISYADTDDFLDQLDYLNGFKNIIIIDVPYEMEGLIERKLNNKKHSITTTQ